MANIATWIQLTPKRIELDTAPTGGMAQTPPKASSTRAVLEQFDRNLAAGRALLAQATDAELMQPWTLEKAGASAFPLPRAACLQSFVFHHAVHHRGQLTVYLRLLDVPLPSTYGPTADAPL